MNRHQTAFASTLVLAMLAIVGCNSDQTGESQGAGSEPSSDNVNEDQTMNEAPQSKLSQATFGAGCFWCTEAVYQLVKGVYSVTSGYSGGTPETANYQAVCSGTTDHVEVVQITFDPEQIRFDDLLEIFWKTHDPTTLNRQGNDRGPQYRSVVFYHDEQQKELAEKYKKKLDDSGAFTDPIVTAIEPYTAFFPAEAYHHDYFRQNPTAGYCEFVIGPKMDKFKKAFADKLVNQP